MSGIAGALAPVASLIPGWGPIAGAGLGLLGSMGGSQAPGQDASTVGGYYQSALNQVPQVTAQDIALEKQSLQPQFDQQDASLAAKEASMGISNSGAARADFGDLAGAQAGALAGAISPLYQQQLGIQGGILGAQPGAQSGAYANGQQNYYNAMQGYGGLLGSLSNNRTQPNSNPYSNAAQDAGAAVTSGGYDLSEG